MSLLPFRIVLMLHLIFVLVLIPAIPAYEQYFCENLSQHIQLHSTVLAFLLDPVGDVSYSCLDGYGSLSCCMAGYTRIEWQVYTDEDYGVFGSWIPLTFLNATEHRLEENNQTLIIEHVRSHQDQKYYRCIGYGISDELPIESVFKLVVQDCSTLKSPVFLQPDDALTTKDVVPGSQLHLECSIFTGSNNTHLTIHWYRVKILANSDVVSQLPDGEKFLEVTQRYPDVQVLHSILIINSTEADDFTWNYVCNMSETGRERRFQLSAKELTPDEPAIHLFLLTLIPVVTISMALTVVCCRFNVDICIFYKTKLQKSRRLEDKEYHVFILYTNESLEDRMFVMDVIRPFLVDELKYRVFTDDTITNGKSFVDYCGDVMENSNVMVVIVSRQLLRDETCRMCIRDMVSTGSKIVYIIREEITNEESSASDIMAAVRSGRKINWLRDDDDEVSMTTCMCGTEPASQPCREASGASVYCRKLQLYLLQDLESPNRRLGSCLLRNVSVAGSDVEQHAIVSTDFTYQTC